MSAPNGHATVSASQQVNGTSIATTFAPSIAVSQVAPDKLGTILSELEVPFDSSVIEWRVTNTTKSAKLRGQIIPYADQRAYTDRLNALVTPAGWTRQYAVHTSANFQRGKDQKLVAKVLVTCQLTIYGIGTHSATGEEWADDDNAATSAEAQAFKRACSCLGLGRYLYHFDGAWVDLDDKRRPRTVPKLPDWATPEGWRRGLRPQSTPRSKSSDQAPTNRQSKSAPKPGSKGSVPADDCKDLVRQVQAMAEPLGARMYRGLLKSVARAWRPEQVVDRALLEKVLKHMQGADRGLKRLDAALERTGPNPMGPLLDSLKLKSLDQVDNLETLETIVLAMEEKAGLNQKQDF